MFLCDKEDCKINTARQLCAQCCNSKEYAEVVHAYWILVEGGYKNRVKYYKCSHCGEPVSLHTPIDKYCFNCGAKMDDEQRHRISYTEKT